MEKLLPSGAGPDPLPDPLTQDLIQSTAPAGLLTPAHFVRYTQAMAARMASAASTTGIAAAAGGSW